MTEPAEQGSNQTERFSRYGPASALLTLVGLGGLGLGMALERTSWLGRLGFNIFVLFELAAFSMALLGAVSLRSESAGRSLQCA